LGTVARIVKPRTPDFPSDAKKLVANRIGRALTDGRYRSRALHVLR